MLLCDGGSSIETDLFLSVGLNPFIVVAMNVSYIFRPYLKYFIHKVILFTLSHSL